MNIRFGVCCGFDRYQEVIKAKYDYIELALNDLAGKSDEEFEKIKEAIKKYGMKVETTNCFFPWDMKVVGDALDIERVKEYAKKAFARASLVGTKISVIGNGGARRIPEGLSYETAKEQFKTVISECAKIAKPYGITIVVEPLRKVETNFINTVEECIDFCKELNIENVKPLADLYHVAQNEETLDAIENSRGEIKHVHIGGPKERKMYSEFKDAKETMKKWRDALVKGNYNGRMSIEGKYEEDFLGDIVNTLAELKEAFC